MKQVRQVYSAIPNLKHKLLSSEKAIRKLTYQIKQLKTEELCNRPFSPKQI